MPLSIERNDLSTVEADAIIVPANEHLKITGGVSADVARAAGFVKMQEACDAIGRCEAAGAVVTPGFGLNAAHVIHAVPPSWHDGRWDEAQQLRRTYDVSLSLAAELGARTIALPLLTFGSYGFPPEMAIAVARDALRSFLDHYDALVHLVIYDRDFLHVAIDASCDLEDFIDDHYLGRHGGSNQPSEYLGNHGRVETTDPSLAELEAESDPSTTPSDADAPATDEEPTSRLKELLESPDASFSDAVLALIDAQGLADPQVYRRANMSRQSFSKLRTDDDYRPSKRTVLALAIALQLSLEETEDLLERAGYALSKSNKADVIVEYFIHEGDYDIFKVNEALFAFDQIPL